MTKSSIQSNFKALVTTIICVAAFIFLAGCGEKSGEVWPEVWSEEATKFFNENVPPLKNLPGKVYHYQVVKRKGHFYFNTLYIDGRYIEDLRPNGAHKVGGVSAVQLDGVHVVYTKGEGYKVSTLHEDGQGVYKALMNNYPLFFREYL
ncbi:hypothetical protein LRS11_02975 [Pseudomonas sp. J452]|uniref:hypothetical protein n=1 Tax=Pseudomonas sp. J452 TaxID=2898441 RepID=UPI0021AE012E|nr:hypothetical protein [Pseudomonas sp. J452]UUY09012.1 hypothetical protein LRS11_02975 [Pseudomonas sp. J452]